MRFLTGFLAAALLLAAGCGKEESKKQVGPLKDWVAGDWVRQDDGHTWTFYASNEFITTGQLPIGGSWNVEEPDKVKVTVSGGGAITASMQLGFPVDSNQNMYATFQVKDDEMRPFGPTAKTSVVFKKR